MADEKIYKCEHPGCGKSYTNIGCLKSHNRIHTNEKPFNCKFSDCGKTFRTMYECAKHHKTIHDELRPYNCQNDGCTQSFADGSQLNRHYSGRKCTVKPPYQKANRYKCEFAHCGKTFENKYRLFKHQETAHFSRNSFGCRIVGCFKSYKWARSLYLHMRKVHKKEPCNVSRGRPRIAQPSAQKDRKIIYKHIEKEPQNKNNNCFHSVHLQLMAELDETRIRRTQPNAKIVFNGPFDIEHTYVIKVTNSSTRRIGFRNKTTNSERIHFVPQSGFLDPNETVLVTLLCDAFVYKEDEINADYITVEWTNASDDISTQIRLELFEDDELVRKKKLLIDYNL